MKRSERFIIGVAVLLIGTVAQSYRISIGRGDAGHLAASDLRILTQADSLQVDGVLHPVRGPWAGTLTWHVQLVCPEGHFLYNGVAGSMEWPDGGGDVPFTVQIDELDAQVWEPDTPVLYDGFLTLLAEGEPVLRRTFRTGFRTLEAKDGEILLNGRPIFLRGLAINPPGREMPDEVGFSAEFATEYISYLKGLGVNSIRLGTDMAEWLDIWLPVCDELGVLVFQGRYGGVPQAATGVTPPPEQWDSAVDEYKQRVFAPLHSHPSVGIYVLSNEQPYSGEAGEAMNDFLDYAWQALREWDPTRLYIGNTGHGRGIGGDIWSMHPYSGWYGGSFLGMYRYREWPTQEQQQWDSIYLPDGGLKPVFLTECLGAYPNATDGFRMEDKQYAAALRWGGLRAQDEVWAEEYQRFQVHRKVELFRRTRRLNNQLVAMTPFSNFFRWWTGVTSFEQMEARPALEQMRYTFAPFLLSWEHWVPNLYADATIDARLHLLHEDRTRDLLSGARIRWRLQDRHPASAGIPLVFMEDEIVVPEMNYGDILVFDVEAGAPRYDLALVTGGGREEPSYTTISLADGSVTNAAVFNGLQYLRTDDNNQFADGPATIAFWVKADSLASQCPVGVQSTDHRLEIRLVADGRVSVMTMVLDEESTRKWSTPIQVAAGYAAGDWVHVALTYDPEGAMTLYLDGVEAGSAVPDAAVALSGQLMVGRRGLTPIQEFSGQLADLRVYQDAIDGDAVIDLVTGISLETPLRSHYRFDSDMVDSVGASGDYFLVALLEEGGEVISENFLEIYLVSPELGDEDQVNGTRIAAGPDAMSHLAPFAERRGWDLRPAESNEPLVLTQTDLDAPAMLQAALDRLSGGGTVLVLHPDAGQLQSLGVDDRLSVNRQPGNIEQEISVQFRRSEEGNERLRIWSDYTGWKEGDEGLPAVTPARRSYRLLGDDAAGRVGVLASLERGLEGPVLCETDVGPGRLVVSGFDLLPRIGFDPVADRMLHDLLLRISSPERPPVIPERADPIHWGNLRSERGLVVSGRQGFAPHTERAPLNAEGLGDMGSAGFHRLVGRRLSSAYSFNALCHLIEEDPGNPIGFGRVWMRPPSGTTRMITEVRNPGGGAGTFSIRINGALHEEDIEVPARQTIVHETPVGSIADMYELEYRGTRGLVFQRTEFE